MTKSSLIDEIANSGETILRNPALTKADWLQAALECLIENGGAGVKITRLADRLGVTRGSFYWHFKDRQEVLDGLLEIWRRKNTANLVKAARQGDGPKEGVLSLFECWLDPEAYDPKLDFAIRAWARSEHNLQPIVRAADQERLDAIWDMYSKGGLSDKQATVMARNLYYMQMGYYALDVEESLETRMEYLPVYFQSYVGAPLDEDTKAAFYARLRDRKIL